SFFLFAPRPPASTPFPSTTLFRSLRDEIERARAARARLRGRPLGVTVDALAAAATRWEADPELRDRLPAAAGLSPAMVDAVLPLDRKSTRLNSSHVSISYAVFCLK